jgi:hypothetical protein
MSDRCGDIDPSSGIIDGDLLNHFNGMHFGLALGDRSSYHTESWEEADWWDDEYDKAYHTQYIAMNHPNADTSTGWDFIGYDWTTSLYSPADPDSCFDFVYEDGSSEEMCGEMILEEGDEPGSYSYVLGDTSEDVGSRYALLLGNSWWYEDFPNLDLDDLLDGVDWDEFIEDTGEAR